MRGISLLPIRSLNFIGSLGFCTVLTALIFLVTAFLLPGNRRPWQEPRSCDIKGIGSFAEYF